MGIKAEGKIVKKNELEKEIYLVSFRRVFKYNSFLEHKHKPDHPPFLS